MVLKSRTNWPSTELERLRRIDQLSARMRNGIRKFTAFHSVPMQFIAPELKTFRRSPRRLQDATRVSAVSVLFQAIAIPIASTSNRHCYQPRKEDAPPRRAAHLFASKRWESFIKEAPQSFRRHYPRHHPQVTVNGSRLPAVQSPRANTPTLSCPSTRPPPPFRKLSTETTLPLYGICPRLDRTTLAASLVRSYLSSSRRELLFTKLTRLGTETLLPAAAETPALANKLILWVTSLEDVTPRSTLVCAAFRHAIVSDCRKWRQSISP